MNVAKNQYIADQIRGQQSNLFVTENNLNKVIERSGDTASVMIAVNTTLEMIACFFDEPEVKPGNTLANAWLDRQRAAEYDGDDEG